ncbi:hypothetical protein F1C58_04340 [Glaciihabitans sp. INWT7]|uniref:hypothetical protein n=1 Tax=Glaciihabitans sp. INWT7 TaxID=2596912 RepID=UPI0016234C1A|nr:hypothetical protein [Glaciihabitans sp. INWT7]QNE46213.1 hypothetical protein F1C58_04340 [Glaciihabitans sp. INWT7]
MVPYLPLFITVLFSASLIVGVWLARRHGLFAVLQLPSPPHSTLKVERALARVRHRLVMIWVASAGIASVFLVASAVSSGTRGSGAESSTFLSYGQASRFGIGQISAFGVATAAVLLLISLFPGVPKHEQPPIRLAALSVRRSGDGERGLVGALVVGLALTALLVVSFGVTAQDGDYSSGPALLVSFPTAHSSAPYPGWDMAGPITLAGIGLTLLLGLCLHRISRAPDPGTLVLQEAAIRIRSVLTRTVLLVAISAVALASGSLQWAAGVSTLGAARFPIQGNCQQFDARSFICKTVAEQYSQPTFTIGIVQTAVGVTLVAAALAILLAAIVSSNQALRVDRVREVVDA